MSTPPAKVVLFVCVENAGRSLMAEAIFNARAPPGWRAESAGTRPADAPHPRTGGMLADIGLRVPSHPPRLLTSAMVESARLRVTMGCLDEPNCPALLFSRVDADWGLPDPAKLDDDGFRAVRDEIGRRVDRLIDAL